uniref:Family with sequence similarity 177 member A1 n=1 Tax=Pavo cristatus TaxID=9049 RepID=A0A8C9EUJ7_PAVCR
CSCSMRARRDDESVYSLSTSSGIQLANGDRGFENVELGVIGKKKKVPRRVIHFASGETMEEYSTDEEEDEQEKKDLLPPVDPTTLTWGPYLWFHMLRVATSTLSGTDSLNSYICGISITVQPYCEYLKDYWQSILLIKLLLFLETIYTAILFIAVSFPHSKVDIALLFFFPEVFYEFEDCLMLPSSLLSFASCICHLN